MYVPLRAPGPLTEEQSCLAGPKYCWSLLKTCIYIGTEISGRATELRGWTAFHLPHYTPSEDLLHHPRPPAPASSTGKHAPPILHEFLAHCSSLSYSADTPSLRADSQLVPCFILTGLQGPGRQITALPYHLAGEVPEPHEAVLACSRGGVATLKNGDF